MPNVITNALVLRRSEYRDYDRMVTLLSPEYGRIDAIARGCRRPKSPLMNASETFCAGEYTLHASKGRYSIVQCQIHESYYALRTDYEKLLHGAYYLQQLLFASLPDQPSGELFQLALRALAFLNYSALDPALVTMAFELHYMALMGQPPRMDSCVLCGQAIVEDAGFDAELGGVVCKACKDAARPISNGARRILMRVPRTKFDAVSLLEERTEWPEAAECARAFIAYRTEPPRQWPPLAQQS